MTVPYWLDEADVPRPPGAGGAPQVAVVGAGITGCSCALTLARAGLAVAVFDERTVAEGASGRNGGFALRGTAGAYPAVRDAVGADLARALWSATELAIDRLAELGADAVRRTGSLRLAADAEEGDELRLEYETLRADGFEAEWIDAPTGAASAFAAALFHPPDAALQPARLVRRLAAHAAGAGAAFHERRRIVEPAETGAPTVVVATDGYPSGLLGPLEGLIIPTRGQMIATEPVSERLFACPHYGRHGFDYWQQAPDGSILAGGFRDASFATEFTTEEETTPGIQEALEVFVERLVGRSLRVTHRWAGLFGLVPDLLPVVGPVPGLDGVHVAAGYSGHGNVLGFLCGDLVARQILGEPVPDYAALFDPSRLA